jgi:hypothetical protein
MPRHALATSAPALALALVLAVDAAPASATPGDGGTPDVATADAGVDGGLEAGADGARPDAAPAPPPTDAAAAPPTATAAPAQPQPRVRLRGRVLERGTRRPLAGAAITLDAALAGESDRDGRFEADVDPGPHHVDVQVPGHAPLSRRLELAPGAPEELFRLDPRQTGESYETVLHAGRPELPQVNLTGDEARKTPGTSGDPLRVIGSLPGVSQIAWPLALYVVRGANPGNTGFYLDGIRVPALFHLALGPSVIHPYLVDGIDFFPGGGPASYGRYASGLVAARTVAPPEDRVHASADVTLYDAGGIATAPIDGGRGTLAVAARYSYTQALFALLKSDSTLTYGDYQVKLDHPLGGGRATVFAFGSLDTTGWDRTGVQVEYASLQFHRLDARWRGAVGDGRLLAGVTAGADWSRSSLFDSPIHVRALSAAPRLDYTRPLGRAVDLEVGADAELQGFTTQPPGFTTQPPGFTTQPQVFDRRQSDLGRSRGALSQATFAALTLRGGDRLVATPGVRVDVFSEEGTTRVMPEPRLDVRFQATPAVALRANAGASAQMPTLPVSVPGFEAFGLADLGVQTARGGSLGVEAALPGDLTASVTGFYQLLRLTDVRDIALSSVNPTSPSYLVARNGRSMGAEVLVRRPDRGRLFGWLAYTLSWSQREDENGVLGRSDWDQRHILNLLAGYRLPGGYSVGARFHYATGRLAPIFESDGQYQQLPDFYQLDLRAERHFVLDRFLLDVYADVANVTRTREVVQLDERDSVTGQPTAQQDAFSIFLPTVGVHGEF